MDIWVTKRLMLVNSASCPSLSIVSFSYKKKTFFWGEERGQNIQLLLTKNTILNEISQTETNKQTKNDIILRIRGIEKIENIEAESRMVVTEGREAGDTGRCWPKGTKS